MQVLKVHVKLHPARNTFGKGWFAATVFSRDDKILLTSPKAARWQGKDVKEFMHYFHCLGASVDSKYVEKNVDEGA